MENTVGVTKWYMTFLRWVFSSGKGIVEAEIEQKKDEAFWLADGNARGIKEQLMQRKLWELGYLVISTFPEAREIMPGDIPTVFDHNRPPFEIITRPNKTTKY